MLSVSTAPRITLEFGKCKREDWLEWYVKGVECEIGACERADGEATAVMAVDEEGDGSGKGKIAGFAVWAWTASVSFEAHLPYPYPYLNSAVKKLADDESQGGRRRLQRKISSASPRRN
jgi:hypothetical protein